MSPVKPSATRLYATVGADEDFFTSGMISGDGAMVGNRCSGAATGKFKLYVLLRDKADKTRLGIRRILELRLFAAFAAAIS